MKSSLPTTRRYEQNLDQRQLNQQLLIQIRLALEDRYVLYLPGTASFRRERYPTAISCFGVVKPQRIKVASLRGIEPTVCELRIRHPGLLDDRDIQNYGWSRTNTLRFHDGPVKGQTVRSPYAIVFWSPNSESNRDRPLTKRLHNLCATGAKLAALPSPLPIPRTEGVTS